MNGINKSPLRHFDGKDLLWLIDEYMREASSRVKKITIDNYGWSLGYFVQWWSEVGPTVQWVVSRTTFQEYTRWLEQQRSQFGKPLGYNTIETAIRRLRQVLHWAYKEGFIDRDYALWVPKPPGEAPLKRIPDPKECLNQLFAAASASTKPTRNRAILAILVGTAVRRFECVNIDIEHVEFFNEGGGQILIPLAKNSKQRYVVFDAITRQFIAEHIAWLGEQGITSGPLIYGKSKRMLRKSLNGVIDALGHAAGLDELLHGPHDLRRMFATYWSRKQRGDGYSQPLSLQMGHADRAMTLLYSKQDLSDVQRVFVSPMELLTP